MGQWANLQNIENKYKRCNKNWQLNSTSGPTHNDKEEDLEMSRKHILYF